MGHWKAPGHREEEGRREDKMEEGNNSAHPPEYFYLWDALKNLSVRVEKSFMQEMD